MINPDEYFSKGSSGHEMTSQAVAEINRARDAGLTVEADRLESNLKAAIITLQNSGGSLTDSEKAKLNAQKNAKFSEYTSIQEQLDHVKKVGNKLLVTAPVSGYITEPKNLENLVGKNYSSEKTIMTITDPNSQWLVWLWVGESGIGPVIRQEMKTPGKTEVEFLFNGDYSRTYRGVVHAIIEGQQTLKENATEKEVCVQVKFDPKELGLDNPKITGVLQSATVTGKIFCEPIPNVRYFFPEWYDNLYWAWFNR
jgi:multidrug resistance efflux pump